MKGIYFDNSNKIFVKQRNGFNSFVIEDPEVFVYE
jgi:hypothetical protein